MDTLRTRAIEMLQRLREGVGTTGEVAAIAAEVLANPPPLIAAVQRYLRELGTDYEGAAAVELLSELAIQGPSPEQVKSRR